MTQVCLLGTEEVNLQYELLSRETAREALAAYDLREPFANAIGVETVSLGAAVALLNDLDWYLTRFVDEALVLEPSISDEEWLSRSLAAAIRNDAVDPAETGRFLRVYGVLTEEAGESEDDAATDSGRERDGESTPVTDENAAAERTEGTAPEQDEGAAPENDQPTERVPPELVEPMLVARTGGEVPEYDLRDVDDTLVVRITESEFGA